MNSTLELMNKRVSLRKYADLPISAEHEAAILHAAMRAPTAGNMMLYSILVVKDKEKKEILSRTCDNQPFIATAPLVMIFLADYHKLYSYYRLSGVKEYCTDKDLEFKGPDHACLMLGISDALIAAQNMVIAAESLGIGSCYIGDVMENHETHRELLNLPEHVFPIGMLTLGYYPEGVPMTPRSRFKQEYVVFEDAYRNLADEELSDMYSEWNRNFKQDNSFGAHNPGQANYARKTGASFSVEMERSVLKYLEYWNGMKL